ncbi:MAG: helix-turn-helix transcriptional regulator [Clostridia bacterium]|nr:helix-turn-helix transcriptional regulator [Clostridia bacterium]
MMDMHLAQNLKRLRRARDMTQEELASFLGVSGQAVSKWETGSGMPDLPLLITTAAFFGVSLDDLVGMSEVRNASRYADLKRDADLLSNTNHPAEAAALYREILTLYPEDWQIMMLCASCLRRIGGEAKEENTAEAIRLYERVAERSPDRRLGSHAGQQICLTLAQAGKKEEAVQRAAALQLDWHSHCLLMLELTEGDNRFSWCRYLASESASRIAQVIDTVTEGARFSREEKIRLLKKIPALFDLLWDHGDYAESYLTVASAWWRITHLSLKGGEIDEAFHALGECARLTAQYDRSEGKLIKATSPLFEGESFISHGFPDDHSTYSGDRARAIRRMPEFDAVRDDECMTPILTLLDDVHAEMLERRETRPVWTPDPSENRTSPDRDTVLAAYRRAFDEMTAAMRGGDYDRDTGWKDAERKAGEFFCFGHPSDEEIRSVFLDFVSCGEILPSPFGSATSEILSWLADTEMDRFPRAFEILDEMEKTVLPPAFVTPKKYPPHP